MSNTQRPFDEIKRSESDLARPAENAGVMASLLTQQDEIFVFNKNYQVIKYKLYPTLKKVWVKQIEMKHPDNDRYKLNSYDARLFLLPGHKLILQYNYFVYVNGRPDIHSPEWNLPYTAVIDDDVIDESKQDDTTHIPVSAQSYLDEPIQALFPISKTKFGCFFPSKKLFLYDTIADSKEKPYEVFSEIKNPPYEEIGRSVAGQVLDEKTLLLYRLRGYPELWLYQTAETKEYSHVKTFPLSDFCDGALPEEYYLNAETVILPAKNRVYVLENVRKNVFTFNEELIYTKLTMFELQDKKLVKKWERQLEIPGWIKQRTVSLEGVFLTKSGLVKVVLGDFPKNMLRIYDGDNFAFYEELSFPCTLGKEQGFAVTPFPVDPSLYKPFFLGQKSVPLPNLWLRHVSTGGYFVFASNSEDSERLAPLSVVTYNRGEGFEALVSLIEAGIDLKGWHQSVTPIIAEYVLGTCNQMSLDNKEEEQEEESKEMSDLKAMIKTSIKVERVELKQQQTISRRALEKIFNDYSSTSWLSCCLFTGLVSSPYRSGTMRGLRDLLADEGKTDFSRDEIVSAISKDKYSVRRLNLLNGIGKCDATGTDEAIKNLKSALNRGV